MEKHRGVGTCWAGSKNSHEGSAAGVEREGEVCRRCVRGAGTTGFCDTEGHGKDCGLPPRRVGATRELQTED